MIGCPVPVLQDPEELEALLGMYRKQRPGCVLEIGSLYGGTLWHWIKNAKQGTTIVSVDKIPDNEMHKMSDVLEARRLWDGWVETAKVNLKKIVANSNDYETAEWVKEFAPFDFIFVDGGHDRKSVNCDYEFYYPMLREGGMIAFHDIAYGPVNRHCIEVGVWWTEMKESGAFGNNVEEIIRRPDQWGIGVIRK